MTTLVFDVPEVSCDHCVRAIDGAVSPLPGVERVEVDVDTKTVTVDGGDASGVRAAIEDAGYDVASTRSSGAPAPE